MWAEIMNRLHAEEKSLALMPPPGSIKQAVEPLNTPRKEWFIQGAEPPVDLELAGRPFQRILYPAPGTVITLDPDDDQGISNAEGNTSSFCGSVFDIRHSIFPMQAKFTFRIGDPG
jgi:hypothetical protein